MPNPHEDIDKGGSSFYHERIARLEERLAAARRNENYIEFSLLIDELTIEVDPNEQAKYDEGVQQRRKLSPEALTRIEEELGIIEPMPKRKVNLVKLASEYEKELLSKTKSDSEERSVFHKRERNSVKPYTIAQHRLDRGIMGYMTIKRPDLRDYQQAFAFVEKFKGPTLTGEGGVPFPLKQCTPERIIAVAVGMYNTAQTRLREFEGHERDITNGAQPNYENEH